ISRSLSWAKSKGFIQATSLFLVVFAIVLRTMKFSTVVEQVLELLQRQRRISYRALKRKFDLDDEYIEDLKTELIQAQRLAVDEDGAVLVWTGGPAAAEPPEIDPERSPLSYTPKHLAEKILTSR